MLPTSTFPLFYPIVSHNGALTTSTSRFSVLQIPPRERRRSVCLMFPEEESTIRFANGSNSLLDNDTFSDLKIKCEDQQISAHKLVVCTPSDVLYAMCTAGFKVSISPSVSKLRHPLTLLFRSLNPTPLTSLMTPSVSSTALSNSYTAVTTRNLIIPTTKRSTKTSLPERERIMQSYTRRCLL